MENGPQEKSGAEMAAFLREVADRVEKADKVDGIAELRRFREPYDIPGSLCVENRLKVDVEVVWKVFAKGEAKR